jgi:putative transposase
LGESTVPADRLRGERPNHVWALDFIFDTTSDGRPFKMLSMCDEFTKKCLGGPPGRSITADAVVTALDKEALLRGFPENIRCDNGPEFIAQAIRDWWRQSGTNASFIDAGSPWQNPYVESVNSWVRNDLFARAIFDSILAAKGLYADWCHAYNVHRPHSALRYQPPAACAKAYSQS